MELPQVSQVAFFNGRRLTDCTKEELIEIVTLIGTQLNDERKRHMSTLDLFSFTVSTMKRA